MQMIEFVGSCRDGEKHPFEDEVLVVHAGSKIPGDDFRYVYTRALGEDKLVFSGEVLPATVAIAEPKTTP